jgi:hypothetical protein
MGVSDVSVRLLLGISVTVDGEEVFVDPDATPTAVLTDEDDEVVATFTADDVTRTSIGRYYVDWPPTTVGQLTITWSFEVGGNAVEETQDIDVAAVGDGTMTLVDGQDVPPSVGASEVCRVTATFLTSGGEPKAGVLVRFSPTSLTGRNHRLGCVADEVTGESNSAGILSLNLMRGLTGTIAVTGLGLVREVTIPDADTIDLFSLVSTAYDPFEVQKFEGTRLRRS